MQTKYEHASDDPEYYKKLEQIKFSEQAQNEIERTKAIMNSEHPDSMVQIRKRASDRATQILIRQKFLDEDGKVIDSKKTKAEIDEFHSQYYDIYLNEELKASRHRAQPVYKYFDITKGYVYE